MFSMRSNLVTGDHALDANPASGPRAMAATLIDSVRAPVTFCGADLRVGLSVGISTFPEHGDEAEPLLKKADVAMYAAKKGGPHRSVIFEDGFGATAVRRLKVENSVGAPVCAG
ncbi:MULTISPECIES: diguanylate cyclase domain-containing protein [unclassified Caballeronia]|uniref:diguanylate cyclase domain-containing protein n=1 Tax=unclassified Caballeronia TaxID=2646786 RepID=UPI00285F0D35|nr:MULTISPECIES: diguanylate cyclase [unclassified Caballeronia]MDR5752528.1 diguanylate cyclase [Caballeronia sp. LZ024]MDR5841684.1 diguanylate cyclase [Caballeronia sp. LZ031]